MAQFQPAVERLLVKEGGFAVRDNRNGAVHWGITQQFLRRIGAPATIEDVRDLPRTQAVELYRKYFWEPLRIGEIQDQRIAEAFFFAAVNMGPHRPIRYLQEALRESGWQVRVDSLIGRETIAALNSVAPNEIQTFVEAFKGKLLSRYTELAEKDPAEYGDDLAGWKARLAD